MSGTRMLVVGILLSAVSVNAQVGGACATAHGE